MNKLFFVLPILAIVLIAGCVSSSQPTPKTTGTGSQVQKPLSNRFVTLQLNSYGTISDTTGLSLEPGNILYVVDLTLVNVAQPDAEKDPYVFDSGLELKASGGITYPYDQALTEAYAEKVGSVAITEGTEVSKGNDITGKIAFQIPQDAALNFFVYDDKQGGSIVLFQLKSKA